MAVYPRLDRVQRPGLVTGNPWAAWHDARRAQYARLARQAPKGSRRGGELRAAALAHAESERASRALGVETPGIPGGRRPYNPGARWHERQAAKDFRRAEMTAPKNRLFYEGRYAAHRESAEVSRQLGLNPQVAFDPFDYDSPAAAKKARDLLYRELRAAGHLRVRRSVLRGQLEKYRGLGVEGRGVRAVYYVTWEDPRDPIPGTIPSWGWRGGGNPRRASRARYCPEQVAPKGRFDPRSFRTVVSGEHRVTVGCPTGKWDPRRKRCQVSTQAQRILHPEGEGTCPLPGRKVRRRRNPPAGPVEIYRRLEFIGATKGPGSRYAGERFLHRFRTPARILGLPDGNLLIQAARGR